jgi:lipopolysaccharide transport system permease protein
VNYFAIACPGSGVYNAAPNQIEGRTAPIPFLCIDRYKSKEGLLRMPGYMNHIWRLRYFWMALVRVDLRKRYRGSTIGLGWSLLHPIAMTAVLCTVFSQLFHAEVRTYIPFLLAGLTFWNFIGAVVNTGCQCFFIGESYIRQHPAPLAIYSLRTTLGASIHFVLGMGIVLLIVWCLKGFGNLPAMLTLIPTLLLLFVFGWAVATFMGVFNVMFQDTRHLSEVVLQILFYVTPILYPAEMLRLRHLETAVQMNPLAAFLDLIREPLLEGRFPSMSAFMIAAVTTVASAGIAVVVLWRVERKMIFYL